MNNYAIDQLTGLPYNKPLIDFSPIVVELRMENHDFDANMLQYFINRCQRLEDAIVIHHKHVAGYSGINLLAEEIMRGYP